MSESEKESGRDADRDMYKEKLETKQFRKILGLGNTKEEKNRFSSGNDWSRKFLQTGWTYIWAMIQNLTYISFRA